MSTGTRSVPLGHRDKHRTERTSFDGFPAPTSPLPCNELRDGTVRFARPRMTLVPVVKLGRCGTRTTLAYQWGWTVHRVGAPVVLIRSRLPIPPPAFVAFSAAIGHPGRQASLGFADCTVAVQPPNTASPTSPPCGFGIQPPNGSDRCQVPSSLFCRWTHLRSEGTVHRPPPSAPRSLGRHPCLRRSPPPGPGH